MFQESVQPDKSSGWSNHSTTSQLMPLKWAVGLSASHLTVAYEPSPIHLSSEYPFCLSTLFSLTMSPPTAISPGSPHSLSVLQEGTGEGGDEGGDEGSPYSWVNIRRPPDLHLPSSQTTATSSVRDTTVSCHRKTLILICRETRAISFYNQIILQADYITVINCSFFSWFHADLLL